MGSEVDGQRVGNTEGPPNMSASTRESGYLAALTIVVMISFIFQLDKGAPVRTLTSVPGFT